VLHQYLIARNNQTSEHTTDPGALQKAADFLKAFMLGNASSFYHLICGFILIAKQKNKGFEIQDAIALLRLDDLYIDTFEIEDGKKKNIAETFATTFLIGDFVCVFVLASATLSENVEWR